MTDFEIRLELARAVCLSTCRAGMCRKSEECCGPGFYGIGLKAALARVNHLLTELKESRTRMVLTEIDRKVLSWMAQCLRYVTPAEIGSAMGGTVSGKAQGLGRMGGRRAKRLIEKWKLWWRDGWRACRDEEQRRKLMRKIRRGE